MTNNSVKAFRNIGGAVVVGQFLVSTLVGLILYSLIDEKQLLSYAVGSLAVIATGTLFWLVVRSFGSMGDQRVFFVFFYLAQIIKLFVPFVILIVIQVYFFKLVWSYVMLGLVLTVVLAWWFSFKFSK